MKWQQRNQKTIQSSVFVKKKGTWQVAFSTKKLSDGQKTLSINLIRLSIKKSLFIQKSISVVVSFMVFQSFAAHKYKGLLSWYAF